MAQKKSYKSLLKEAIAEFDTSDHLDVKGPMLDPILSWNGNGELPIYKDAASILERYYFNENSEKGVRTLEGDTLEAAYENDKGDAEGKAMDHAEGTGTEQAGTSDNDSIDSIKDDIEDALALEQYMSEEDDEHKEPDGDEGEPDGDEKEEVKESLNLEMENAIIEKLIAEMEGDDDKDEEDEEDVNEADIMTYTDAGPKFEAPDEKESKDPEEHTTGAGTEQAGTGDSEGEIPDRKDLHDQMVEPKNYNEQIEQALAMLEQEMEDEKKDDDEEEDEDLDVDKEVSEAMNTGGIPMGMTNKLKLATTFRKPKAGAAAVRNPAQIKREDALPGGPARQGEDYESDERYYAEALRMFKEEVEDDEQDDNDKPDNVDSDDVRV